MKKYKIVAVLLGILTPGLGSIYARKVFKGVAFLAISILLVISWRYVAFSPSLFYGCYALRFLFYFSTIIIAAIDVNPKTIFTRKKWDKTLLYISIIVVFLTLKIVTNLRVFPQFGNYNLASVPTPAMDPAVVPEDWVVYKTNKEIHRNEVCVFQYPDTPSINFIKRCVGMPGDSLHILNKDLFINKNLVASITTRYSYSIPKTGFQFTEDLYKKLGLGAYNVYDYEFSDKVIFNLTKAEFQKIKTIEAFKNCTLEIRKSTEKNGMPVYPNYDSLQWTPDFYGPIYIPKKGDKIVLNKFNSILYKKCIELENENIFFDNFNVMINGVKQLNYTFKNDYYFMMGDNRDNSMDSRYYGFVCSKYIIGKALYVPWRIKEKRFGVLIK